VTVTIPASGKAIVTVTALISNSSASRGSNMGFTLSGATTLAANDAQSLYLQNGSGNAGRPTLQSSATFYLAGLNPGSTTFTAKYSVTAGMGTFANRTIVVIPIS
jgi:hypothetical protein